MTLPPGIYFDPKNILLQRSSLCVTNANHKRSLWSVSQQGSVLPPVHHHTFLLLMPPESIILHKQRGILLFEDPKCRQIGLQSMSAPAVWRRKAPEQLLDLPVWHQNRRQLGQQLRFSHAVHPASCPSFPPPLGCYIGCWRYQKHKAEANEPMTHIPPLPHVVLGCEVFTWRQEFKNWARATEDRMK